MKLLRQLLEDIDNGEMYIVDRGPYDREKRYELWRRTPGERTPIVIKRTNDKAGLKRQYPNAIIYDTGQ